MRNRQPPRFPSAAKAAWASLFSTVRPTSRAWRSSGPRAEDNKYLPPTLRRLAMPSISVWLNPDILHLTTAPEGGGLYTVTIDTCDSRSILTAANLSGCLEDQN